MSWLFARLGERFRRFVLVDQFGDDVDLNELYNHDAPILMVTLAEHHWSKKLAKWFAGQPEDEVFHPYSGLRAAVADGELRWVFVERAWRPRQPPAFGPSPRSVAHIQGASPKGSAPRGPGA